VPLNPRIIILLATRNGAEFIQQQLESFRAQSHSNWELLVSDDGSTDDTIALVEDFARSVSQRVLICHGPQKGFWQNFASLVRRDDLQGDLYAYSDQDDIWLAGKLAKAAKWFEAVSSDRPGLYFTRTELIHRDGSPAGFSRLFTRAAAFENALVQNFGGGNTMVFNRATRFALLKTPASTELVSHDWWTYQVVTGIGGAVHYDSWPSLKYRQHGKNLMGKNVGLQARLDRLMGLAGGQMIIWNDINLRVLHENQAVLLPRNIAILASFTKARTVRLPRRLWLLWRSGVYRQTMIETVALYISALFGRL
jgi:glycosyltransferase involved in cell wall biosynthesis